MKKKLFSKMMSILLIACIMTSTVLGLASNVYAGQEYKPNGYVTDEHNIMAYYYNTVTETFDIFGYNKSWLQTTCGNSGIQTYIKVSSAGDTKGSIIGASSEGTDYKGLINLKMNFTFANEGKLLGVNYIVKNISEQEQTFSIASCADVQIGNDDCALITPFEDYSGFKMVNQSSGDDKESQFNFFGKDCLDVTNVDAFWYGKLGSLFADVTKNVFKSEGRESGSFDSAISYAWNNRTIGAGETKTYKIYIGVGGKDSESVGGKGEIKNTISFIDQGETLYEIEVVNGATDSAITIPTPPSREGFVFNGWYTGENGTGIKLTEDFDKTSDTIFYSYWSPEIVKNSVTFVDQGKTLDVFEVVSGSTTTGSAITIPTPPSREGFIFLGWYTGENGTGIKLTEDFDKTSDTIFYSYWSKIAIAPIHKEKMQAEPNLQPVLIDGVSYKIGSKEVKDGTTTINVDAAELSKNINMAENGSTVIIPISSNTDKTVSRLDVLNINEMAQKDLTLSVAMEDIHYNIPTSSIDTNDIVNKLKASAKDIAVNIIIEKPNVDTQKTVNSLARDKNFEVVVNPIDFKILAERNGQSIEIEKFNNYVPREIEISPEQAKKITTAVVIEKDGTLRHVPTHIYLDVNNKYVAKINSRTNSLYTLINNSVEFEDARGKWYEDIANEMAGRMIISGKEDNKFYGDDYISRAEFASIIVKALGLPSNSTKADIFTDVSNDSWYYGAVGVAYEYGLIKGKGNSKFDPNSFITREEAMIIIKKAANILEYPMLLNARDLTKEFSDLDKVSSWAEEAMYFNLYNNLIKGSNNQVRPKDNITRAESASVILKLLQNSKMINVN